MTTDVEKAPAKLQELVAEVDTGGRKPVGFTAKVIFGAALAWALFQTWYASPLPFALRFAVLNDTEARAIHLAFALFLAFLAWPAGKRSPRDRVPVQDWVFALAGAFASAYLMLFYNALALRPGQPTSTSFRSPVSCCCSSDATRVGGRWPCSPCCSSPMTSSAHARLISHRAPVFSRLMSHVADDRGRVRHRAWRVDGNYFCLCSFRRVARPRRRRQLHDAGLVRRARPSARRSGEGLGRVVGIEWHDLGIVGVECRLRRYLQHSAHEKSRLRRRQGRRDRDDGFRRRADHAAGDGAAHS